MTPAQFGSLTVPEFEDVVEAALWMDARRSSLMVQSVAMLLGPYLDRSKGDTPERLASEMLHGDPIAQIEYARTRRLERIRATRNAKEAESWR